MAMAPCRCHFRSETTKEPVLKNRRPITSYMITAVSSSSMKPASRANRWQGSAIDMSDA
jgi:hypothetical protein